MDLSQSTNKHKRYRMVVLVLSKNLPLNVFICATHFMLAGRCANVIVIAGLFQRSSPMSYLHPR